MSPESRRRGAQLIADAMDAIENDGNKFESNLMRARFALNVLLDAGFHVAEWRKVEVSDKDGSLKLIAVTDVEQHATEDEWTVRTIGHCNFENDEMDRWQMAGWCWAHDHFTEMQGGIPTAIMDMPRPPTCVLGLPDPIIIETDPELALSGETEE